MFDQEKYYKRKGKSYNADKTLQFLQTKHLECVLKVNIIHFLHANLDIWQLFVQTNDKIFPYHQIYYSELSNSIILSLSWPTYNISKSKGKVTIKSVINNKCFVEFGQIVGCKFFHLTSCNNDRGHSKNTRTNKGEGCHQISTLLKVILSKIVHKRGW